MITQLTEMKALGLHGELGKMSIIRFFPHNNGGNPNNKHFTKSEENINSLMLRRENK